MDNDTKAVARVALAAIVPPIAGTALVWLGAVLLGEYGWTLFVLLPVFLGFASAAIYDPRGEKGYLKNFAVGLSSLASIGVMLVAVAIEGLICLVMALPLAVPLMTAGSFVSYGLTQQWRRSRLTGGLSVLLFVAMPMLMGFEKADKSEPVFHEVVTSVEIDAPIGDVWKNVVAFPPIDAAPEGVLNLGIAYPIQARIDGEGVGATRRTRFNTGTSAEPITAWREPNLLAFDVAEQPVPMTEMTPYAELQAAHLQYIRMHKGQFRLYERGGKTIVEGATVYTHDIGPDAYWKIHSDEIVDELHLRVLNHIKAVSERR